jgi:hypothetical protein
VIVTVTRVIGGLHEERERVDQFGLPEVDRLDALADGERVRGGHHGVGPEPVPGDGHDDRPVAADGEGDARGGVLAREEDRAALALAGPPGRQVLPGDVDAVAAAHQSVASEPIGSS